MVERLEEGGLGGVALLGALADLLEPLAQLGGLRLVERAGVEQVLDALLLAGGEGADAGRVGRGGEDPLEERGRERERERAEDGGERERGGEGGRGAEPDRGLDRLGDGPGRGSGHPGAEREAAGARGGVDRGEAALLGGEAAKSGNRDGGEERADRERGPGQERERGDRRRRDAEREERASGEEEAEDERAPRRALQQGGADRAAQAARGGGWGIGTHAGILAEGPARVTAAPYLKGTFLRAFGPSGTNS